MRSEGLFLTDLHIHTTASDGTLTPAEAVREAHRAGIAVMAVTDHDTVDGVAESMKEAGRWGVLVIPGVEISVRSEAEMHILGYFHPQIWPQVFSGFAQWMQLFKERRNTRNTRILDHLNRYGMALSMEDVLREARGDIISRLHIAGALVAKGYEDSISDAFSRHIGKGCHAYEPKEVLTPTEGIRLITTSGGLAVLAHPCSLNLPEEDLADQVEAMRNNGLAGLEAIYWDYDEPTTERLKKLASRLGLLVTAGSDFHGKFRDGCALGVGKGNMRAGPEIAEPLLASLREAYISRTESSFSADGLENSVI